MSGRAVRSLAEAVMMVALFAVGILIGVRLARQHVKSTVVDPRVSTLDLDQATLGQLIHSLSAHRTVPIQVDWAGLESSGFDRQARLPDLHLHDVTLGQIFSLLGTYTSKITSYKLDGTIFVTSADSTTIPELVQIYEVSDILQSYPRWDPGPPVEYTLGGVSSPSAAPEDARQALVRLIRDCIAPDVWLYTGGTTGSLTCIGGRLLVMQTPEKQEQVAELLAQLREVAGPRTSRLPREAGLMSERHPLIRFFPDLQLKHASIGGAAKLLRQASGVNLAFDWDLLRRDAGIDPDSPAPIDLPAGQLIEQLTVLLGGSPLDQKLRILSAGNVVRISSARNLPKERPVTRFYPFSDSQRHLALRPSMSALVTGGLRADVQTPPPDDDSGAVEFWPGWVVVRGNERAQASVLHLLHEDPR